MKMPLLALTFTVATLPFLAIPARSQPSTAAPQALPAVKADKATVRKWVDLYLPSGKEGAKMSRLLAASNALHRSGAHTDALALIEQAVLLAPLKTDKEWIRGVTGIVSAYYRIGEYDKALAYATAQGADNAPSLQAIGAAQATAKDPGAKAMLLKAQAKAAEIEELQERALVLRLIAESFLKAGLNAESKAAVALSQATLAKDTRVQTGIPRFESRVENAALLRRLGDRAGAQRELASLEKDVDASPYVYNEMGMVLFEIAREYRALGDAAKADALNTKAAPMIKAIESNGNEVNMLARALVQQARAGQVMQAVARAKTGELRTSPAEMLLVIGEALGEAGKTNDARTVFAEAKAENAKNTDVAGRLLSSLDLAAAMGKAGDKARAIALLQEAANQIPAVPQVENRPAFWALWVEKMAPYDLAAASARVGDTMESFRPNVYRALAEAAAGITP